MNKDILKIDNARIIFRNFSGRASKFNSKGDRNFCVVIDNADVGRQMADDGWNIKIRPPREDGEEPFMYLPVKIKYGEYPPTVYLSSGPNRTKLTEETVNVVDDIDILGVDLDIRPYDWDVNGNTGRTAYLQSMWITQKVDRFAQRYSEERDMDEPEE